MCVASTLASVYVSALPEPWIVLTCTAALSTRSLAPASNALPIVPSTRALPWYFVVATMRVISSRSVENSVCRAVRSPEFDEAACAASSFMRSRMLPTVDVAPSATCSIAVACSALRDAC